MRPRLTGHAASGTRRAGAWSSAPKLTCCAKTPKAGVKAVQASPSFLPSCSTDKPRNKAGSSSSNYISFTILLSKMPSANIFSPVGRSLSLPGHPGLLEVSFSNAISLPRSLCLLPSDSHRRYRGPRGGVFPRCRQGSHRRLRPTYVAGGCWPCCLRSSRCWCLLL